MTTKIKKTFMILLVSIIIFGVKLNTLNVDAADTKGPVLTYVNIHTYMDKDLVAGNRIDISFNVKDTSGLSDATMVFKKVNDEGYMRLRACDIEGFNDYEVNKYTCTFDIDKYAETGKYQPYLLFVYDGSAKKNMTKYVYNNNHEKFYKDGKGTGVPVNEYSVKIKQPKKYKITEFNSKSFKEDWKSVKKNGTIVVKGSKTSSSAKTVLPVEFLKYVKKQNIKVIIPDLCGRSEIVIQGEDLKNSQTKKELKIYVKREDLTNETLGTLKDEMYHEVSVQISDSTIPVYLWVTPSSQYLEVKGTFPTTISKITKNSKGKITKVTTLLKKAKFYTDNTVRKSFSKGLGAKKAYFAISSQNNAHKFSSKIIKKASFTKSGQIKLTCKKCGEVRYTFISKVSKPELSYTSYIYNGKKKSPSVTVTDSDGRKLKKGTDYTVTYESGRTKAGRYAVTVKLKGNYTGTKKVYFDIKLKEPKNVSAKLYGYNDVEISWDKVTGADGYMVYHFDPYEEDSDKQYKLVGSTSKNVYKAKDMAADDIHQFVVKAYVKDGSTKVLSDNSKKVSVKTMGKVTDVDVYYGGNSNVRISWDGINERDGYQISCSLDKSETNIIASVEEYNDIYTHAPEEGQKLYYKVRAYLIVDGKEIYAPWSSVKSYTLNQANH